MVVQVHPLATNLGILMTKPNYTKIRVLLDRSGSMVAIKEDMEGGFNAFVEKQKEVPGDCDLTLCQFDSEYEVVYSNLTLDKVPKLSLIPRGPTALYDATGRSIISLGAELAAMKEEDRPNQVIFVIITDGYENASKEYNSDQIKTMIEHQKDKYNWNFVFLGANQDAIEAAATIGIGANAAVTYQASSVGVASAMRGLSNVICSARLDNTQVTYSQADYDKETKTNSSNP